MMEHMREGRQLCTFGTNMIVQLAAVSQWHMCILQCLGLAAVASELKRCSKPHSANACSFFVRPYRISLVGIAILGLGGSIKHKVSMIAELSINFCA